MQEYVGLLELLEEDEIVVVMTSKHSSETCDDEKSKNLAKDQVMFTLLWLVLKNSRVHFCHFCHLEEVEKHVEGNNGR